VVHLASPEASRPSAFIDQYVPDAALPGGESLSRRELDILRMLGALRAAHHCRVLTFNRMVEVSALDGVYRALADGSRRNIVWRLAAEGELKVTDLARPFDMSLNAVSKHIKVLEQAGLVRRRVSGRDHWLSLRSEPLAKAHAWIGRYQRFWESRIDALEQFLTDSQADVH